MSVTPDDPDLPALDPRVVGQRIKHERQERGADPGPAGRGRRQLGPAPVPGRERAPGADAAAARRRGPRRSASRSSSCSGRSRRASGPRSSWPWSGPRPTRSTPRSTCRRCGPAPGCRPPSSSTSSACTRSCAASPSGWSRPRRRPARPTASCGRHAGPGQLLRRHRAAGDRDARCRRLSRHRRADPAACCSTSLRTATSACATSRTCRRPPGRSPTSATGGSTSARAAGPAATTPAACCCRRSGHFLLGHGEPAGFAEHLRQRTEANYFAAAVLMPEQALVPLLARAKADRALSVEDARDVFGVSDEMAAHRFTNVATRHLELPVHFVRTDESGRIYKAYENDGVVFPADLDGAIEGQTACRFWAARRVFSVEHYPGYQQYTDTPQGTYFCWSQQVVQPERLVRGHGRRAVRAVALVPRAGHPGPHRVALPRPVLLRRPAGAAGPALGPDGLAVAAGPVARARRGAARRVRRRRPHRGVRLPGPARGGRRTVIGRARRDWAAHGVQALISDHDRHAAGRTERRRSLGDTAVSGAAGPALVELLPRVLHDSPAAMLLVDLNRGEVTYANRQAILMAPDLGLPVKINDWSRAAGLRDPDGVPLSDTGSPLSRIASGQPVAGESVTAARDSGVGPGRRAAVGDRLPAHRRARAVRPRAGRVLPARRRLRRQPCGRGRAVRPARPGRAGHRRLVHDQRPRPAGQPAGLGQPGVHPDHRLQLRGGGRAQLPVPAGAGDRPRRRCGRCGTRWTRTSRSPSRCSTTARTAPRSGTRCRCPRCSTATAVSPTSSACRPTSPPGCRPRPSARRRTGRRSGRRAGWPCWPG